MDEFPQSDLNHYARLGVLPTSTTHEIVTAYKQKRAEWVALADQGDEQAPEQLRLLDGAYATLADSNLRVAYDRSLRGQEASNALVIAANPDSVTVPNTTNVPTLVRLCPHPDCGALNPIQLSICQKCGRQISRPCPQCGQPVPLGQPICLRCNTPAQEYDQRRFVQATQVEQQVQHERREEESRNRTLEAFNMMLRQQAVVFWIAVVVACVGLSAIAWFVAYLLGAFSNG